MTERWRNVKGEAGELARGARNHTYQQDKRIRELFRLAVTEVTRLTALLPAKEREETEEERDLARYALKWMNICRRSGLDPDVNTIDLVRYFEDLLGK